MSQHQQHLVLADGRGLAYAEHGDPQGTAVLYFHGTPSTSAEWRLWDAVALCVALDCAW
jgi:pimeloyl-ACP methyl ester carboxylesterase